MFPILKQFNPSDFEILCNISYHANSCLPWVVYLLAHTIPSRLSAVTYSIYFQRTGWSRCNALDLYRESSFLKSRQGNRLSWLNVFLSPSKNIFTYIAVWLQTGYWLDIVKVKVTLRLAVYRQSLRLGVKPLEDSRPDFFFQLNSCGNSPYVTFSLTRRFVCLL
jgi:hypothetical protein